MRKDLKAAFRLGFATYKGDLIAVSGLRKPRTPARARLFAMADTTADPKQYKVQLDWIYLHPDHRKKGVLTKLLKHLLAEVGSNPLFALARSDDELALEVLDQYKFEPARSNAEMAPDTSKPMKLFLRGGS
ncbi:GNAT family N-acetyltransferase [Sphingomonas sp. MMS12-HWE2-04]|uniref:GNAT family N-acetyltransferase n=1 Tax=Sphingomonas sp. MMS12-HWE2-04 TaxID=3234199 RepID=UPI00384E1EA2